MGPQVPEPQFEGEIASLADLERADLIERWKVLCRGEAPKGISTILLVRAVAYQMQTRRYGSPKRAMGGRLRKAAGISPGNSCARVESVKLKPGARLVREWNGSTHTVDVVEGGYQWNGNSYRSLSEIARQITGARWSGPRFFGLGCAKSS